MTLGREGNEDPGQGRLGLQCWGQAGTATKRGQEGQIRQESWGGVI